MARDDLNHVRDILLTPIVGLNQRFRVETLRGRIVLQPHFFLDQPYCLDGQSDKRGAIAAMAVACRLGPNHIRFDGALELHLDPEAADVGPGDFGKLFVDDQARVVGAVIAACMAKRQVLLAPAPDIVQYQPDGFCTVLQYRPRS